MTLNDELRTDIINWLLECDELDDYDDDEILAIKDAMLIKWVQEEYVGGLAQFIKDSGNDD